jgi:hypothetical protein
VVVTDSSVCCSDGIGDRVGMTDGDFGLRGLRERFGRGAAGAMSSAARGVMEETGDADSTGGSLRI